MTGWLTTRDDGGQVEGDATFGGKLGLGRFAGGSCGCGCGCGCGDGCGGFNGTAFIFANASASNADMSTPFPCIRRVISSTRDASSVCVAGGAGEAVGDWGFGLSFTFDLDFGGGLGSFGGLGAFG